MKLFTPKQMQEMDALAIHKYHIPSILLMEHAAYEIFKYIKQYEGVKDDIVIVCGPGNNGGDGLAIAWQLATWTHYKVEVILLAEVNQLTYDGMTYYEMCKALNLSILEQRGSLNEHVDNVIQGAHVVVDALFGTGLSREVTGAYKEIIELINQSQAHIVSVDIPSGIDGLTGKVKGCGVYAHTTITFMAPKMGLCLYPAIEHAGQLQVVDIGIPRQIIEATKVDAYTIEASELKKVIPRRPMRSNKGTYGKVLTIGGQLGMTGAITLTSSGAYRAGCGTVTAVVPCAILEIVQTKLTEVMAIGMPDEDGHFGQDTPKLIGEILPSYQVACIGPGMGRDLKQRMLLMKVLESDLPCVIDADALFFLPDASWLRLRKAPTIITPHPGEMARIMGCEIRDILERPIEYAREFAINSGVITVLKLEKTVIADRTGDIYINRQGNSGLAKGGSGDALTGIIAGLLAQKVEPIEAAKLGVYLQTRAADLAKESLSEYSFQASDTLNWIGKVFLELLG